MRKLDLTGVVFGRLTVLKRDTTRNKGSYLLCLCSCGKETSVCIGRLRSGKTKSCGCLISDVTVARNTIHGMSKTPEYQAWAGMKKRCFNIKANGYENYGARGITVAPEWIDDFDAFYAHVGPRPSQTHSIDRIDNSKGYFPGNVRWATKQTQSINRRNSVMLSFNGVTKPVSEWAIDLGISADTIKMRIRKLNWTVDEAISKPKRGHNEPLAISPKL